MSRFLQVRRDKIRRYRPARSAGGQFGGSRPFTGVTTSVDIVAGKAFTGLVSRCCFARARSRVLQDGIEATRSSVKIGGIGGA